MCFRRLEDDLHVHDFIEFYQIPDISVNAIKSVLQDALIRLHLSLDKCRGQCYDSASNMQGKNSGVATKIQEKQPEAFPTHCHCHSSNLSLKDSTKELKLLSDAMDISKEIVTLIKCLPKREESLGRLKKI